MIETKRKRLERQFCGAGRFFPACIARGLQHTTVSGADHRNDLGIDTSESMKEQIVHFYQFNNPESVVAGFRAAMSTK